MARQGLQSMNGQRKRFSAMFVRYGVASGWRGSTYKTVLVSCVTDLETGAMVTDHLWFKQTKGFASLGVLSEGVIVEFDARVSRYTKGYRGRRFEVAIEKPVSVDYRLSYPTRITLIERLADGA
jgi:hypothetical protein